MSKSKKRESRSKFLVISGFLMLVVIVFTGLWLIFKNLVDFSARMIDDDDKNELIIVGNVINGLYEIEGTNNLLIFESAADYLSSFDSIRPIISFRLDSLKQFAVDSNRMVMLDSIEILLDEKQQNLTMIHALMDSVRKAPRIMRETVSSFVPSRLNKEIADYLQRNEFGPEEVADPAVDTTVIRQERKSLFRRLGDAFAGRQDSTVILQNRPSVLVQKDFELVIDTVVNMVRYSERLNLERQRSFQSALLQRQSAMNQTNLILTNKIDNLLKIIEKEEIDKTLALIDERDLVLNKSYQMVFIFSIIASLIALLFGLLFVIDFNRIQRYKRRLEASNARINQLLHSREQLMLAVSHDIKAPMGSILGYLELLQSDENDEGQLKYVSNMKKSGNHILQLVTSLLDFNKIESNAWRKHNLNFKLYELIESTALSFSPAAEEKALKFIVNNHIPETLIVDGDPFMIRLILTNLISNAIKFTHEGIVKINAAFDTENHLLHISVEDSGIGIDSQNHHLVFKEFTQLNSKSQHEFFEGSGLGLAITKGLIEQLDGKISLESEKNKGSVFMIEIPLEVPQNQDAEHVSVTDDHFNFDNYSALVIDDDKIQLAMISEMLKRKDVDTVTVSDIQKVPEILRQQHFDIVFIDLQMPEKSGFALVDEIIKSGWVDINATALIAVSAKSEISSKEYSKAGFKAFLNKPFTSYELYKLIDNQLDTDFEEKTPSLPQANGIEALIEIVKENKTDAVEILKAFIYEAKPLKDAFQDFAENSSDGKKISYYAHKMLPLFKMMEDESTVQTLEKLDKKIQVSDNEIKQAEKIINNRIEEAQQLIGKIQKS